MQEGESHIDEGCCAKDGLREQKELAQACAILSFAISVAMLLSNFPGDRKPIENATMQVGLHQRLLEAEAKLLKDNQTVLEQNRTALAQIQEAQAK